MEMDTVQNTALVANSYFSAEDFYFQLARRYRVKLRSYEEALRPVTSIGTKLAQLAHLVELSRPGFAADEAELKAARKLFWYDTSKLRCPEICFMAAMLKLQESADHLRIGDFLEHTTAAGEALDWLGEYVYLRQPDQVDVIPEFAPLLRLRERHLALAEFLIARKWSGLNADIFLPVLCDEAFLPTVVVSPDDAQRLSRDWYFRALAHDYELISPFVPTDIRSLFDQQHGRSSGVPAIHL